ncbi:MAG TPA: hypothetical protein DDZ83_12100 [Nitrospinae bacterium]|nr:hypothetical protein [Nitrospinota bacterium]
MHRHKKLHIHTAKYVKPTPAFNHKHRDLHKHWKKIPTIKYITHNAYLHKHRNTKHKHPRVAYRKMVKNHKHIKNHPHGAFGAGRFNNPRAAKVRAVAKARAAAKNTAAARKLAQIGGRIKNIRAQLRKLVGQARSICARGPKASRRACMRRMTGAPAN